MIPVASSGTKENCVFKKNISDSRILLGFPVSGIQQRVYRAGFWDSLDSLDSNVETTWKPGKEQ